MLLKGLKLTGKQLYFGTLGLIVAAVLGVIVYNQHILLSSDSATILVPVYKSYPHGDVLPLNYRNMIPERMVKKESGTIVAYINSFGIASFVRPYEGENNLNMGEILLDYYLYRKAGLYPSKPRVYFGFPSYKLSENTAIGGKDIPSPKVSFAILKVSKGGSARLVGLADSNYNVIP